MQRKDTTEASRSIDGFALIELFPNLKPQDFEGVSGRQGDYSVDNGKLLFTGNGTTASARLTKEGFTNLLQNCSQRLRVPVNSHRDIDNIILQLLGSNQILVK